MGHSLIQVRSMLCQPNLLLRIRHAFGIGARKYFAAGKISPTSQSDAALSSRLRRDTFPASPKVTVCLGVGFTALDVRSA